MKDASKQGEAHFGKVSLKREIGFETGQTFGLGAFSPNTIQIPSYDHMSRVPPKSKNKKRKERILDLKFPIYLSKILKVTKI